MPFASRFGLHVIVNGHVVKDLANGEVQIPFESEYSVRLRNRHKDRYAVVKLFIDGEEMSKGGFIIPPNSHRDIERSSHKAVRFKFVDLQGQEALDAGKDQANHEKEMGVIEARFHLQKTPPQPVREIHHHHSYPVPIPRPYPVYPPYYHPWRRDFTYGLAGVMPTTYGVCGAASPTTASCDSAEYSSGQISHLAGPMNSCDAGPMHASFETAPASAGPQHVNVNRNERSRKMKSVEVKDGATVDGSASSVVYGQQWVDIEDDYVPLKLFLRGFAPEVAEAVVEQKPNFHAEQAQPVQPLAAGDICHCDQCGAKSARKSSKFCHVCGAKLLC